MKVWPENQDRPPGDRVTALHHKSSHLVGPAGTQVGQKEQSGKLRETCDVTW